MIQDRRCLSRLRDMFKNNKPYKFDPRQSLFIEGDIILLCDNWIKPSMHTVEVNRVMVRQFKNEQGELDGHIEYELYDLNKKQFYAKYLDEDKIFEDYARVDEYKDLIKPCHKISRDARYNRGDIVIVVHNYGIVVKARIDEVFTSSFLNPLFNRYENLVKYRVVEIGSEEVLYEDVHELRLNNYIDRANDKGNRHREPKEPKVKKQERKHVHKEDWTYGSNTRIGDELSRFPREYWGRSKHRTACSPHYNDTI